MATYIKSILPSGRGIWLEKLTTKQYRHVNERVASRLPDGASTLQMTNKLSHEMLLAAFRGITADIIPVVMTKPSDEEVKNGILPDLDVDAMLASVPEHAWIKPTFEDLIIDDGPRSLEALLDDPADYLIATQLATTESLKGGGSYRGKIKREFVGQ